MEPARVPVLVKCVARMERNCQGSFIGGKRDGLKGGEEEGGGGIHLKMFRKRRGTRSTTGTSGLAAMETSVQKKERKENRRKNEKRNEITVGLLCLMLIIGTFVKHQQWSLSTVLM